MVFRATRRQEGPSGGPATEAARKDFKRAVKKAKREYWRTVISDIKDPRELYRITRWITKQSPFRPPLIVHDGVTHETSEAKALALRQAILERRDAGDDI